MAEDKEQDSEKGKKKGGSLKLIIIIVVLVLLLAAGGGAAYIFLFANADEKNEGDSGSSFPLEESIPVQPAVSSKSGVMYDFPVFTVNLADPSGSRYLRLSLSAELPAKNSKLNAEIEQKLPKIKDSIITALSSKTYEEISTSQGKIALKQELLRRINALLSGNIQAVYITDFVVQ